MTNTKVVRVHGQPYGERCYLVNEGSRREVVAVRSPTVIKVPPCSRLCWDLCRYLFCLKDRKQKGVQIAGGGRYTFPAAMEKCSISHKLFSTVSETIVSYSLMS